MIHQENLKKIVIVGGGTAGWMTASALSHVIKDRDCEVQLVESPDIGTIGVGEATIPPLINFLKFLGIDEKQFMATTKASFKLGIKFRDWHRVGEEYWHPFGSIGVNINGSPFFHNWLKYRNAGARDDLAKFSPAAVMGEANRFYHPHRAPQESFLAGASYAYHFDASLVAQFLRNYSEQKGVKRVEGNVVDVELREDGGINALSMANGDRIEADFFIDCSGFKSLLIGETLHSPYVDWSNYLPCDRAVTVPTEASATMPPYTLAVAREAGWTWRIPLQHRVGNGYVYASQFCSEDEAASTLLDSIKGNGEALADPVTLKFTTGYRQQMWSKNCLAIGLSAGFIEPLESTAIHLITQGIKTFINLFPSKQVDPVLAREFNRRMVDEYEQIRDFIVLHYCTTARDDTPFWRWCRTEMPIPESLKHKIELFSAQGRLHPTADQLFKDPSWYCVFLGMGVTPRAYDPLVDATDFAQVKSVMKQVKDLMKEMAAGLPEHRQYLTSMLKK